MTATALYAIVDPASEPALYEHAARLEPASAACLFEGRIAPQLKQVSPHLVELAPGDPLSALWQREGWGKAWGIFLTSSLGLMQVRRRLRHFTQARLPSGEGPVLFRFWDPRVLRVYMPLVEPDQAAEWFKGIESFTAESEDGKGSFRYALRGGAVAVEAVPR